MPARKVRGQTRLLGPPLPDVGGILEALVRLAEQRMLSVLLARVLPPDLLKRELRARVPRSLAAGAPHELLAQVGANLALAEPGIGTALAEALHDRLAWDREPASPAEWEQARRERPLEALWLAAISGTKSVRKSFRGFAAECLRTYRASPACPAPSWEYVDFVLATAASTASEVEYAERRAEDAERRADGARAKVEDLREELRRLRREDAELRALQAEGRRRIASLEDELRQASTQPASGRLEELERRLRKAEQERSHLAHERERLQEKLARRPAAAAVAAPALRPAVPVAGPAAAPLAPTAASERLPSYEEIARDDNPRRRVLRQVLRKMVKKGKIGGAHTDSVNVYRGVPDHDKGVAKEVLNLLSREGFLIAKTTVTDLHVSLSPERLSEILAMVEGHVSNPRLERWIETSG